MRRNTSSGSWPLSDILASLSHLDRNADRLFAAVGHALTVWEREVEMGMARLYSIFTQRPYLLDAYQEFGDGSRTTKARVALLGKSADHYFFAKMNDEEGEAAFKNVLAEVITLTRPRHQIAHGHVVAMQCMDPDFVDDKGWAIPYDVHFLSPPWYSVTALRTPQGEAYRYGSREVDEFAKLFAQSGQNLTALAGQLSPPP